MNNNKKNKTNIKRVANLAIPFVILMIAVFAIKISDDKKQSNTNSQNKTAQSTSKTAKASNKAKEVKDSDIVIPVNEVTEKARFYPADINGTKLEVIAVKAPDGTIRTAFNTCQVCYSSGKGYYKQQGNKLVCQNCGNTFGMGDVEVTKGGCNPVPITDDYKTVNKKNITISKDILLQATTIFANWKS